MTQTPPAIPPSAMIPPFGTEPPPPPPPYMPDGQKKAVGIAIAALILGICGFIPGLGLLCGLIGIVLGIVALAQGTSRKGLAIAGIVTGAAGPILMMALTVSILLPTLGHAREQAKRALCGANLNGIGSSITLYSIENDDAYPPNLEIMISNSGMPKEILNCPSAKSKRDCDYFYSPPAKTTLEDANAQTIMACDFKDNHGGEGRTVLFADGHTQWMTEKQFQQELQQTYNTAFAKALRKAEGQ